MPAAAAMTAHDFSFTSIDGGDLPLAAYRGKVVLLVNTASMCGFTGQYEGLQSLWTEYKDKGLVVLGVPSDDFGGQELDDAKQVKEFCTLNYGIDFPMADIVLVCGAGGQAALAGMTRKEMGYQNVCNVGGISDWIAAGGKSEA